MVGIPCQLDPVLEFLVSRMLCIVFMINESKASSVPWLRAGPGQPLGLVRHHGPRRDARSGAWAASRWGSGRPLVPVAGFALSLLFGISRACPLTRSRPTWERFRTSRGPDTPRAAGCGSWAWRGPLVDFQAELFLSEDTAHLASQRRALSRHEGDARPRGAPRTAAPSGRPPGPEMEPRGLVWPGLRGACLELEQMFF